MHYRLIWRECWRRRVLNLECGFLGSEACVETTGSRKRPGPKQLSNLRLPPSPRVVASGLTDANEKTEDYPSGRAGRVRNELPRSALGRRHYLHRCRVDVSGVGVAWR